MTNYFKLNNYYNFYGETVIATTVITGNHSNLTGHADFTHEIFPRLTNQKRGHSRVMLELSLNVLNYCISVLTDGWESSFKRLVFKHENDMILS